MDMMENIEGIERRLDSIIEKAGVWQKIFDEAPWAIAVFTAEMNFFLVNKQFCEITGYEDEELYERNLSLVLRPKDRRMHKREEKKFALHPEQKIHREGLSPYIYTKSKESVAVDIALSYFINDSKVYYVAFLRTV